MAQVSELEVKTINTATGTIDQVNSPDVPTSPLSEEELKNQVEELNNLMDPAQLTQTQQHCIAQIVACFIANHIHRYYHSAKYVIDNNNKRQNLHLTDPNATNTDNELDSNQTDSLHLIYPIPILEAPPKSLFSSHSDESDIITTNLSNPESQTDPSSSNPSSTTTVDDTTTVTEELKEEDTRLPMMSVLKQPSFYRDCTSTDYQWARSFLQSFCEYLKVPKTQIEGYSYFLENKWIEPEPFFETLKWNIRKQETDDNPLDVNLLRIPLLLLQFAISEDGYYDSRLRSLLKTITSYCKIRWNEEFAVREYSFGVVLHVLLQKKHAKSSTKNYGRWAKVGAVGLVGGALIAFTGGIAAPAVAAGLGAIGLTATGTFLLTTTGTATLYLLFGVTGAGYAGLKMHNTVCEVKDFKFISLSNNGQHNGLNVIITVNGWLEGVDESDTTEQPGRDGDGHDPHEEEEEQKQADNDNGDVALASDSISDDLDIESREYWTKIMAENGNVHLRSDCYTLQFEKKNMLSLGEGLKKFVSKKAVSGTVSSAAKVGLAYTTFATLVAALTWPVALLAVADYIDNPWTVAFAKSKEAGLVLADCLASGNQGRRPVTLIGYSLGARVIYYALKELVHRQRGGTKADRKDTGDEQESVKEQSRFARFKRKKVEKEKKETIDLRGMIENVVIIGGPLSCNAEEWTAIRSIVSDRIINCYSEKDWVLKFVYRAAKATTSVAGLMPIRVDGVENVDLSECIDGHSEYHEKTPVIIKYLIESHGLRL